jgi:hypothetical protein
MEAPGEVKRDAIEYRDYTIALATERMREGDWAVVARVVHTTRMGEDIFPVPVPDRRFPTEEEARTFGAEVARRWIDDNAPRR